MKFYRITVLFISSAFFLGCSLSNNNKVPTYLITETPVFSSLDPLDADITSNLPVQRMLYSSILEVSPTDDYSSFLLESFTFKELDKKLLLKLKPNLRFSDGSPVTSKDVSYSILRMLKARPEYPVLSRIKGKKDWDGNLDNPPKGIKIGDLIVEITFDEMSFNPLSRFCMEIFSVIPSKCVDAISSNIICKDIPSSGPYVISKKTKNSVTFNSNPFFKNEENRNLPPVIEFKYLGIQEVLGNFKLNKVDVIAANEVFLDRDEIKALEKNYSLVKKPKVRFKAIELYTKGVFSDLNCRRVFVQAFRNQVKKSGYDVENSIFTKIMRGYQSFGMFKNTNCKLDQPIRWGFIEDYRFDEFKDIMNALRNEDNGLLIEAPVVFDNFDSLKEAIKLNRIDVMITSSGFWAADPAGDIRMFFTPGMHESINHITSDPELQKLLTELENDQSPENFIKVNRYLYEDAKFNVYRHAARFYMTNKNVSLKNLPLGITSPAPYTVLEKLIESN